MVPGVPGGPMARMSSEMDEMFDRFFGDWSWPRLTSLTRVAGPPVDMIDRQDEVILRADLPGCQQKDIDISVEQGILTLRGQRKDEHEAKETD